MCKTKHNKKRNEYKTNCTLTQCTFWEGASWEHSLGLRKYILFQKIQCNFQEISNLFYNLFSEIAFGVLKFIFLSWGVKNLSFHSLSIVTLKNWCLLAEDWTTSKIHHFFFQNVYVPPLLRLSHLWAFEHSRFIQQKSYFFLK